MSITPTAITQGPGVLWYAPFGTTVPADSAILTAPSSPPWTDAGGTQGGIMAEVDNTYVDQVVDQVPDPVGGRLTKRAITITTALAESSLANFQLAMNNLLQISNQSSYATVDLLTTTSATQPTYSTLIIDGWAPTTNTTEVSCRRRIIVWKVLSQSKLSFDYSMDKNSVFNMSFTAYYVSGSVSPWHSVDQQS